MVRDVKEIQFVRRRLNTNFSFLSKSFESAKPNYSDDELWVKTFVHTYNELHQSRKPIVKEILHKDYPSIEPRVLEIISANDSYSEF